MHPFTTLFLAVLGVSTMLQIWLARRHIANVQAHRAEVPAAFRDAIPLEAHQKAADYTVTGVRFGLFELLVNALFLLAWTVGGGVELFDNFWRGMDLGPLLTGVAVIISAVFVMGLLELPLAIWHTFAVEQRFGFNHSTPRLFLIDTVKQTLLSLALGLPLAAVALWLMSSAGTYWWLYLWAVWISFSLVMMWAYPAFHRTAVQQIHSARRRGAGDPHSGVADQMRFSRVRASSSWTARGAQDTATPISPAWATTNASYSSTR